MKIIKITAPHGHMGVWSHEENGWAKEIQIGEYVFTTAKNAGEVDGMVCWWEFTEEFLEYGGPRVFYCCEPSFYFRGVRGVKRELRKRLATLRMDEFAWHYHPHPDMRVVHESFSLLDCKDCGERSREAKAVAVLGNLGRPIFRNAGRQRRLEFIIHSGCDIYGPKSSWVNFQLGLFSRSGFPETFRGECARAVKFDTLSNYHACICLENSSEELYFTEKFPDAVRAGCVPIYHAHPTVREVFLNGAIWVDPADYHFDARSTVEAALKMDRVEVDENNKRWFQTHSKFQETSFGNVYLRLAGILKKKAAGEIRLPEKARRANLRDEY
jgi:hypothetical protein